MRIRVIGLLTILLAGIASVSASDPTADAKRARAKFVVYAAEEDADLRSSLYRVLLGNDTTARIEKAGTLAEASESPAEVLVFVMPSSRRGQPKLERIVVEALRQRKIIGIGYGAAELFGQLGLEIYWGNCAHGTKESPRVTVRESELLGAPEQTRSFPVFDERHVAANRKLDLFGVFLPPAENDAVVDVIARWTDDPNYAPIVRQGNCVLIGIPAPASSWTAQYNQLIRETCLALYERKLEPFATARRVASEPGTQALRLAPFGSTEALFTKSLYYRFTEPKRLSVQLDDDNLNGVRIELSMRDRDGDYFRIKEGEARPGQAFDLVADISPTLLEAIEDRDWSLRITNFGKTPVECRLTVTIEELPE